MSDIIKLLPDHVANQIAAGEVVQRPASVVKELLENAIDAQSSLIKLIVKDAGKTLIQVIDNGIGMSVTDARLSFERHATSKIRSAEDLFKLGTKGFRGEALASIAAIAHVEMNTRQHHDEVATKIIVEGSKVKAQEVTVAPAGTSVAVKNLFYNIPARRNFLKSNQVELRHIIDEFHRVALAHPGVQFEMYQSGSEIFKLPVSNLRQRIVNIFGRKTNEKLVPVEEATEILTVKGFVYKPEFSRKSRGEQFFFANNRFIKSPYLHHAVMSAFEGLINPQSYPGYFLYLEVDPSSVDINIHPTKTEVKFEDEHAIYAMLRSTIKHSLGQFNVAPVLDFERDRNLDVPYDYKNKAVEVPAVEVDAGYNPFSENTQFKSHVRFKKEEEGSWESLYTGLKNAPADFSSIEVESEEVVGSLFDDSDQERTAPTTYQLHRKYVITSIKSGLVIIDQHRAHQRVLYERFLRNITVQEAVSQQLLFPLELHFSATDIANLKSVTENLEQIGFNFSSFNEDSIVLTGIPMNVKESEVSEVLEQLIYNVKNEVPEDSFSLADVMAKTLSKSLAVRSGDILKGEALESLVHDLFACKEPSVSPANQPTFITLSVEDIDKKF